MTDRQTSHSRAVLAIKTPVSVTLARKNESLDRILSLVPGSMLTFDAHCDEPLTLEAGGKPIATGETVKIGDKFGLRIREILHNQEDELSVPVTGQLVTGQLVTGQLFSRSSAASG